MTGIKVPTFASILLLCACANTPQESVKSVPAPPAQSASGMLSYDCESGERISATYPSSDTATIQYRGQSHELQIAISGSGARYVGDGLEWWTKGTGAGAEGTLFRHQAEGTTGKRIESCIRSPERG